MSFPPIARSLCGLCLLTAVTACSPAAPHASSPFDLAPADHRSAPSSTNEAWHGSGGHGDGQQNGNPGIRNIGPNAGANGFSGSTNGAASLGGPGSY